MNINFDKMNGLVPAIIQDADTRQVLMLGFMNQQAYDLTVMTGKVTFWSRTRQTTWTKGETSGNFLHVVEIKNDCDDDTLLIRVHPMGPVCHTGADTCWGEKNEAVTPPPFSSPRMEGGASEGTQNGENPLLFLSELQDFIEERHRQMPENSYTTSLFRDGVQRMSQKVGEEALELVIEAVSGNDERMIYEGSDMLYHLLVLLTSKGLRIEQMAQELVERHRPGWQKH